MPKKKIPRGRNFDADELADMRREIAQDILNDGGGGDLTPDD